MAAAAEFLELQSKLFLRWVNQKLAIRGMVVEGLKGFSDGMALVNLMEVLSETKFHGKMVSNPKMRPQKINNASLALDFIFKQGIQMKLKPSAENIVDGEPVLVLGLLWGIMQNYLHFNEDDDEDPTQQAPDHREYSVRDSLLNWVQNQIIDYKVECKDLTKSLHNGLVLCAIIHKFLPQLICEKFDALDPAASEANLQKAFNGAEVLFGLEQYLKPSDIPKLDEKCMIVYISEYYYGAVHVRKIVSSVRRIGKLIKFTEANDVMRAQYKEESKKLIALVGELQTRMADRTIDNTFQGAKGKLEDFYVYKKQVKGHTVDSAYLGLETIYNKLTMRLTQNMRPAMQADPGSSLSEMLQLLKELEISESKRKQALHSELNRQITLAKLNEQHKKRADAVVAWSVGKRVYLNTKEEVNSVGGAVYQLSTLSAFNKEAKTLQDSTVKELKALSANLKGELFEFMKEVVGREAEIQKILDELRLLSAKKQLILEDDLAREKFKEKVLSWNSKHVTISEKTQVWLAEKEKYLNVKEEINSIRSAQIALSILAEYAAEKKDTLEGKIPPLQKLGEEILTAEYKTQYSSYRFGDVEALKHREAELLKVFPVLDKLHEHKLAVLTDDLKREMFKEELRQANKQHVDKFKVIEDWAAEKVDYLKKKDAVSSIPEAKFNLGIIQLYAREKIERTNADVGTLKSAGKSIVTAKYKTEYSQYIFETPDEVVTREKKVDDDWAELDRLYGLKNKVLEDDLAREEFKEKLRQQNELHKTKFGNLDAWVANRTEYLTKKEAVDSVAEATLNLNTLLAYKEKKQEVTGGDVAAFKKLGEDVRNAKYETELSKYVFQTPQELIAREKSVDNSWVHLDELCSVKLAILEDDLAREKFRENLRNENEKHKNQHAALLAWGALQKLYLEKKEPVNSIAEAEKNLSDLGSYETGKFDTLNGAVVGLKKRGSDIIKAKYQTKLSTYIFPTPQEINARESDVDALFVTLDKISPTKKAILVDDLAREIFKEKLRQEDQQHKAKFQKLKEWVAAKKTYLQTKEAVNSIREAEENLNNHTMYCEEKVVTVNGNIAAFNKLGEDIRADKYQTTLSSWVWPSPGELVDREKSIGEDLVMLDGLSATKRDVLVDDLDRERFKEKLRQKNQQHVNKYNVLTEWTNEKRAYLGKSEPVNSISEAEKNLNDCLSYIEDKIIQTNGRVAVFKKLGADILADRYETKLSSWVWPTPDEIRTRERDIDHGWDQLDGLCKLKKAVLEDDLGREIFKERLRQQNEQHILTFKKLQGWVAEKTAYNEKKEAVDSVRDAQFNLNTHAAYDEEKVILTKGTVAAWKKFGAEIRADEYKTTLSTWKFPTPQELVEREKKVDADWGALDGLAKTKRAILEDDDARERFRENLRQRNEQHKKVHSELTEWINSKKAYLNKKEPVDSIPQATENLANLFVFKEDKVDRTKGTVTSFKKLGDEIMKAKYETKLSSFVYRTPEEIVDREKNIDGEWVVLDELADKKQAILEDDLAREEFREKLRQENEQHKQKHAELMAWDAEKKAYLQKKEQVDSISDAQINLNNHAAYEEEKNITVNGSVAWLKALGNKIITAKYETKLSSFVFKTPSEIKEREQIVDAAIVMLDDLSKKKFDVLDDDLKREKFRDGLRQDNESHKSKHQSLKEWFSEKKAYLEAKEPVNSISQAQENLATLAAYTAEKGDVINGGVAGLKSMGAAIIAARYQTKFSSYTFPTPKEIKDREGDMDSALATLDDLRKKKLAVLQDDLAREQFKERLRQQNAQHIERHEALKRWIATSTTYLNLRDKCNSIAEGNNNLTKLEAWKAEKDDVTTQAVGNLRKLGSDIKKAKYKTALSEYVYNNPAEIDEREAHVESEWVRLDGLREHKGEILDDDLEREQKKEELRLNFADVAGDFERWAKDVVEDAASTHFGFNLEQVEEFDKILKKKDESVLETGAQKQEQSKSVHQELTVIYGDTTENVYTKENPKTIEARLGTVKQALEKRQGAYKTELARQRALDELCKQFAKLIEPFVKSLEETKGKVTASQRDLNGQLSYINEMAATATKKFEGQLAGINEMQNKLDMEGITTNRHTVLTATDATVQLQQFITFLNTKRQNIEEEIKHNAMRGLTKEELDEIASTFKRFDKNGNGVLNTVEFRACLYAVGDERGSKEIRMIMKDYGGEDGMDLDGFREFNIKQMGDTNTKAEIIDSFAIINGEIPPSIQIKEREEALAHGLPEINISCTYTIKQSQMDLWLPTHDRAYIAKTAMPISSDVSQSFSEARGYYFQNWVDEHFSR